MQNPPSNPLVCSPEEWAFISGMSGNEQRVQEYLQANTLTPPITPQQFIDEDRYFGKSCATLWPWNRQKFFEIVESKAHIIVLTGSIGWGKGFMASILEGWFLQEFLRYIIPQAICGLAVSSPIYCLNTSVSATHARDSFYKELRGMMEQSEFFCKIAPFNQKIKSQLVFEHFGRGPLTVLPSAPDALADIGLNIVTALIDELSFMDQIKDSKRAEHGTMVYDQGQRVFENLERRIVNRTTVANTVMGKIILVSSANYEGDVIEKFCESRKGDPTVFIVDGQQIEAKPGLKTAPSFYLFLGDLDKKMPPEIIADKATAEAFPKEKVRRVPNVFLNSFRENMNASIRDLLGIRTRFSSHLFPDKTVVDGLFEDMPAMDPVADDLSDPKALARSLIQYLEPDATYAAHFDLAGGRGVAGFAMSRIEKILDPKPDQTVVDGLPDRIIIRTDVAISLTKHPLVGEVHVDNSEELIIALMNMGIRFCALSWDGFQSQGSHQRFITLVRHSDVIHIDNDKTVYHHEQRIANQGRHRCVYNKLIADEMKALLDFPNDHKIEKGKNMTKDLSDAVACTAFQVSRYSGEFGIIKGGAMTIIKRQTVNDVRNRPNSVFGERVAQNFDW